MLISLWLPILLSGVALHVASAVAWMVLPHHKAEWSGLRDEAGFAGRLQELNLAPGQYLFPHASTSAEMKSEEFQQRLREGPWGTLSIWADQPSMGMNMLWTFVFYVGASFLIAYLSTMALGPGDGFLPVFRFVGTAGIMTYCCAGFPNAIWFKRKMLYNTLDGIAFGLITGLIFALFWPGV